MALISKPDYTYIWASGGAIVEPSDVKKQLGWIAEVPPHQWENWAQNRQDQFNAHVNQRGIAEWDGLSEYEAGGLSYVQGSNGVVYKSVAASGPSTTVQDPTTDVTDTYWTIAFTDAGTALTEAEADALYLRQDQNGADVDNAATFRANIGVVAATDTVAGISVLAYPPAFLAGYGLSNNGGAPTTTVDVAGGYARNLLNTVNISQTGTLSGILQTSGAWAAGTGQNKLDTGARAANTTYHVHAIRKTSDGTGDILFSLSPSAPTMPSGYSGFRRIGSVLTDAGNLIKAFTQIGREFLLTTPLADVNAAAVGSGTVLYAVSVPTGIVVQAIIQGSAQSTAGAGYYHLNTPGNNDVAGNLYGTAVSTGVSVACAFGKALVRTNTSAQIQMNSQLAGNTHRFSAYGWVDRADV